MKPKNLSEFYGRLFLILGSSFLLIGLFAQAGIMKMKPGAHSDPRLFSMIGCLFLVIAALSLLMGVSSTKKNEFLLKTEKPILASITSVKQLYFTRFTTSYPYLVYYTYEWEGVQYQGKSGLFWTAPSFREHDKQTIYINVKNPRHSALKL